MSKECIHFLGLSVYIKVKFSRYRPGVAQRVCRGIALLLQDPRTRRGWVVSSTPRPHFTRGKAPVPILQEAGWTPGPVWKGGKSRPHQFSIPDRPARSQSLYRLSYPFHTHTHTHTYIYMCIYIYIHILHTHIHALHAYVSTHKDIPTQKWTGLGFPDDRAPWISRLSVHEVGKLSGPNLRPLLL